MNDCMNSCISMLAEITSKGFDVVGRKFSKQASFNRKVGLFSLVITAYVIMLHKQMEKLSDEVEELKQTRGE